MAFTFIVKNTSIAGREPTVGQIQKGELAVNLVDHKLYSHGYDENGNDVIFEIGEAGETPSGGTDERPSGPSLGDLYFDTDLEVLLYWNGSEWVPVGTEALELNDLTDVDTSGVTDGMVLAYNGANWVPFDPATFNVQAGRALSYDNNTDPDTLNADIATETSLGVVSVGEGLEVSLLGELSTTPVEIPPGTIISETAPADPEAGQLWWADTDVDDGGGRLYIYTGDEWVDTSLPGAGDYLSVDQADDLYLSKTVDDTAAGLIEFEKGVSITGLGDGVRDDPASTMLPAIASVPSAGGQSLFLQPRSADSNENNVELRLLSPQSEGAGGGVVITHNKNRTQALGQENVLRIAGAWTGDYTGAGNNIGNSSYALVTGIIQGAATDKDNFISGFSSGSRVVAGNYWSCYRANDAIDGDTSARYVGFHSKVNDTAGSSAFGFYAEGNARNTFQGVVAICQDNLAPNFNNTGGSGWRFDPVGDCSHAYHSTNPSQPAIWFNRTGSTTGKIMVFHYAPNAAPNGGHIEAGNIRFTSSNSVGLSETSDYRLKENIVDLPNAVDRVKAIKPYQYTFKNEPGVIHEGFLAHELAEHSVLAVSGEKDATEVFGTYTDPDGNVETDVSEPEAMPYGATFEPQGTRDIYQSVAPMALIPLLTKALQETIAKNEELEARLAALEGA